MRSVPGIFMFFKSSRNLSGRRADGFFAIFTFIISAILVASTVPLNAKDAVNSSVYYSQEQYERLFILSNTEFTLLHEIAHVLIWELKPPVFGREEDAADTIAVMAQMMLPVKAGEHSEIEKLQAVADGWKLEWQLVQEEEIDNAYWDLHSLEIQRYYNIACLVYGADPANRAEIVQAAELPTDRAESCHEEYALAKRAMDWLLTKLSPESADGSRTKRGITTVQYARNNTLEGEKIDKWLRESGIAERLAEAMTRRFDLPRDIVISFESCPFPNAAWNAELAKIQFCHSLLNRFLYLARELSRERNVSADKTIWHASTNIDPTNVVDSGSRSVEQSVP